MNATGRRPLRLDSVAERRFGAVSVRFPAGEDAAAEAAADLLATVRPVVDEYLGAPMPGEVRLELLPQARASGANPVTGVLRHALRGLSERSPRAAGILSYQLGRIAWWRGTREAAFQGAGPRAPDWLVEAALLPLLHIWSDRDAWVVHVAEQVALFTWRVPFPEPALRDLARLTPSQRVVATAQCVLRSQTLTREQPDWVRRLRFALAADPGLTGIGALERVTGVEEAAWERRFGDDLEAAVATASHGRG